MEKRKNARSNLALHIDLTNGGRGHEIEGFTNDISPEGAYLVLYGAPPAEGSPLNIHFKIWTGHENISRQLKAKVLRRDESGAAVGFLENDLVTSAVIEDILHYQKYERRSGHRKSEPAQLYCAM